MDCRLVVVVRPFRVVVRDFDRASKAYEVKASGGGSWCGVMVLGLGF